MSFTEIITDPHFRRLAVPIRVAFSSIEWKHAHPDVPFWLLYDRFAKFSFDYRGREADYMDALRRLLEAIAKATPRLRHHVEDFDGYVHLLDQHGFVVPAMFGAWVTAAERFVTPAEIAEATGTAESNWRNRAAAGDIPGALKKGKQWLLPHSVVEYLGVAALPEKAGESLEPPDEPLDMTDDEYAEVIQQLNREQP